MRGLRSAFGVAGLASDQGVGVLAKAFSMARPISLKELLATTALYVDLSLKRTCTVIRFSGKQGLRALAATIGVSGRVSLRKTIEAVWAQSSLSKIKRIFVLVLENRSFDHMLGFSGITGVDSRTGVERAVDGLTGTEFNLDADGSRHLVSQPGWLRFPWDPNHEHPEVMQQICGKHGGCDVPDMSGFARDFDSLPKGEGDHAPRAKEPGDIMRCMSPEQIPIMHALAKEFAVVDRWYSSMPGSTWPNRFFVHAATAGGYDHSPTGLSKGWHWLVDGYDFTNGNIFDRLDNREIGWQVYSDANFPQVWSIANVNTTDMQDLYPNLHQNLNDEVHFLGQVYPAKFPYHYIFLELDNQGEDREDQHPSGHLWSGEQVIKDIYEMIRGSKYWEESALIITYDEHGGFYDHVPPPDCTPPGDKPIEDTEYNFHFQRYGVRVPAIVISPWIPRNTIVGGPRAVDVYDHTTILATLEERFEISPLTDRDAAAQTLSHLFRLTSPRTDTPETLPSVQRFDDEKSVAPESEESAPRDHSTAEMRKLPPRVREHYIAAAIGEVKRTPKADRAAVIAKLQSMRTMGELADELHQLSRREPRRRTKAERRAAREAWRRGRGS